MLLLSCRPGTAHPFQGKAENSGGASKAPVNHLSPLAFARHLSFSPRGPGIPCALANHSGTFLLPYNCSHSFLRPFPSALYYSSSSNATTSVNYSSHLKRWIISFFAYLFRSVSLRPSTKPGRGKTFLQSAFLFSLQFTHNSFVQTKAAFDYEAHRGQELSL